jgi:molybdate transport system substrate-binding protein
MRLATDPPRTTFPGRCPIQSFKIAALLVLLLAQGRLVTADAVRVAAASDLIHALPALTTSFERATGHVLRISYGSSGNLTRQIIQGAPFDIFFSANEAYIERLEALGLTESASTVVYALGRLSLFVPPSSAVAPAGDLSSLAEALRTGALRRLAIANPAHAPYGMAAREALRNAGLWRSVQPVLVLGENASQAAQFTFSGNVDAGLIPHAIAVVPNAAGRGRSVLVDHRLYAPLRQRAAVLKDAGPTAIALLDYVRTPEAKAVLVRYGFRRPEPAD